MKNESGPWSWSQSLPGVQLEVSGTTFDRHSGSTLYPDLIGSLIVTLPTTTCSRSGYRDPMYRYKVDHGLPLPPRSASCTRVVTEEYRLGSWFAYPSDPTKVATQFHTEAAHAPPALTTLGALPTLDSAMAYGYAYKHLMTHYLDEQFRFLSFAAEYAETHRMIKGHLKDLTDFLQTSPRYFRRIKRRKAKAWLKKTPWGLVSGWWLHWWFGIMPFLSDIEDAVKALAEIQDKIANYRKSVSGHYELRSKSSSGGAVALNTPVNLIGRPTGFRSINKEFYTLYKIGGTFVGSRAVSNYDILGISPGRIAPAVWEATPFSWLADYFSNLGELIDAYSTGHINLLYPWLVTIRETSQEEITYVVPSLPASNTTNGGSAAWATRRRFEFIRGPTVLEFPAFTFRMPNDIRQAINMAAVAGQRLKSSAFKP